MLPTRLNVLPPEKKKHLQQMIRNEFLKGTLQAITILVSLIGIALLGGRFVLQNYFSQLGNNIIAINVRVEEKNETIVDINKQIIHADAVFAEYTYWPSLLESLNADIPDDIIVSQIRIDRSNNSALIVGKAVTRDALLSYGEVLRAVPFVTTANIPLGQLTTRENIAFSIDLKLE